MRPKYTEKKIKQLIATGTKQSVTVVQNLVLDIHNKSIATFHFRGKIDGKRKRFKIGTYGEDNPHLLSVGDAIEKVNTMRRLVSEGINPQYTRYGEAIRTVDDLFHSFFAASAGGYKNERRMYKNHIEPVIGEMNVKTIQGKHLQHNLKGIVDAGYSSTAQRILYLFRSVFSDAFENSIINSNIARNLDSRKHAGAGKTKQREALTEMHLRAFLDLAQQHPNLFPEPSMIAIVLLLVLGVRKMELLAAEWRDIDWDQKELHIWTDSTKTKMALAVPLPDSIMPLFERLKYFAGDSKYLFPSRRKSGRPHIHDSTINTSINNLFGKNKRNKTYSKNLLGELNVPYFIVHDLRRTFRSLLPKYEVSEAVAEACLNHKPRGIAGVYNRYNYLEQRRIAHEKMAKVILPMAGFEYHEPKQFKTTRTCCEHSLTQPALWANEFNFKMAV